MRQAVMYNRNEKLEKSDIVGRLTFHTRQSSKEESTNNQLGIKIPGKEKESMFGGIV